VGTAIELLLRLGKKPGGKSAGSDSRAGGRLLPSHLRPDEEHVPAQAGVESAARKRRDLAVDVEEPHLVLRLLLVRGVKEDLAGVGRARQRRVLAVEFAHGDL